MSKMRMSKAGVWAGVVGFYLGCLIGQLPSYYWGMFSLGGLGLGLILASIMAAIWLFCCRKVLRGGQS